MYFWESWLFEILPVRVAILVTTWTAVPVYRKLKNTLTSYQCILADFVYHKLKTTHTSGQCILVDFVYREMKTPLTYFISICIFVDLLYRKMKTTHILYQCILVDVVNHKLKTTSGQCISIDFAISPVSVSCIWTVMPVSPSSTVSANILCFIDSQP